ncbi:MAG: hypothetical protein K9K38_21720 [Rhodoferax sp.]|nr:hypothetical protein [Rhodoferax sp.]
MPTIAKDKKHLAELLGVSPASVTQMAKRGMPCHNLEAAQAWREANLDPARRKGQRHDQHYNPTPPRPPRSPHQASTAAAHASALMDAAGGMLEAGQSIETLIPSLRFALRAVPKPERDTVGLHLDAMKLMVAHVLALVTSVCDDGTPAWCDGSSMTDIEAQEAGEFWYQVAAGEMLVASAQT